ncbi:MAG: cytochrome C oxidase subunit IV family protein [Gemmatimonadota bacterium]|jgi:caa(3)-type oxidase subunit IV
MASAEKVHPPYMLIWFVLAVLMFGKVGIMMLGLPTAVSVTLLVIVSLTSALLVAMYYMHLRFEPKKLWIIAAVPIPLIFILILTVIQEF